MEVLISIHLRPVRGHHSPRLKDYIQHTRLWLLDRRMVQWYGPGVLQ